MLYYETITETKHSHWIVFIHGAGGSLKTWSYQASFFKSYYNLLLLDLRDHGQSKNVMPAAKDYSFSLITEDIKKVLDQLSIKRAHFISLSFGSVLIQDFSLKHPSYVGKMIMAGGIFKGTLAIRSFVSLARIFNSFLSYSTMYKTFSYLLMPRRSNQKARRVYQLQARKLTQKEYLKWVGLYGEFFKLLNKFYNQVIKQPTLIIMGSTDYVFLKDASAFARTQGNVSLISIEGAGHICNIDESQLFNTIAMDFLDGE